MKNPTPIPALRELRTIASPIQVDAENRTVTGYFALFNERSLDLGGFTEVIAPGAFTRSLTNNPDVLALVDHDPRKLLGRTSSGTLQVHEDQRGLAFSVSLPDTSYANDLRCLMDRGDIKACSFGFVCEADDWSKDTDGTQIRTVKSVRLIEGSIVATPAYPSTTAQLRSLFPDGVPAEVAKHQTRSTEDACTCPCPECVDGNCDDCSDLDCDCEGCDCDQEDRSDFITEEERQTLLLQLELASL